MVHLKIPYNPRWNADRVTKLVEHLNSVLNRTGRLHRHPAFVGSVENCLQDQCGVSVLTLGHNVRETDLNFKHCPEPQNNEERELVKSYNDAYVHGNVT